MSVAKFSFNKDFQIKVLGLMFQDFDFLLLSHDIILPQYFSDEILGWYFEAFRDHYLDYQMRMDDAALRNELKKASSIGKIKSSDIHAYLDVYKRIKEPVSNKQYITDEVTTFCRHQAIKRAVLDVPPLLSNNSFEEIEDMLRKALLVGAVTYEMGSQYFVNWPERLASRILRKDDKVIATGITLLDKWLGGGLKARQLGLWMAPTSRGKSIALVHCGKRAIINKKKVLHYTMELSEDEVAERYDASFSRIKVRNLVDDESELRSCLDDMGKTFGNSLIIKYYPMQSATIHTIRGHALRCIASGFVPDLILIDYLDLVKPLIHRKEKREQLTDITLGMRGLAGELDVPCWSATQSRRAAYNKETHDEEDTSEDIGKAMHTDVLITINQTKSESEHGKMRLFLAKNRNGPRNKSVSIMTDLERMCFFDPTKEFDGAGNLIIKTKPTMPKRPPPTKPVKRPPLPAKWPPPLRVT